MQIVAGSIPLSRSVRALHAQNEAEDFEQFVAEEVPIAFSYAGFPHAVMMASPDHLRDFAHGFSLTEGIVESKSDIRDLSIESSDDGLRIQISLEPDALHRYLAQRRIRTLRGNTSCGLCGAEDFSDVSRPSHRVPAAAPVDTVEIVSALENLRAFQPLSQATKGAHASAWVSRGKIVAAREDVGRHNSLDKLIGAGMRGSFSPIEGFCLITSRCSFEMVQKAIAAGYAALVSVSAPTALAIRTAASAGLTLSSLTRDERQIVYAAPHFKKGI